MENLYSDLRIYFHGDGFSRAVMSAHQRAIAAGVLLVAKQMFGVLVTNIVAAVCFAIESWAYWNRRREQC